MRKAHAAHKALHRSWYKVLPGDDPFRQLVDSIRDYAIYMLDREGIVRTWNAGAERIKGYKAAEIIGKPLSLLYAPNEIEHEQTDALLAQAAAEGRVELEGRRVRRGGETFWANTVITALYDQDGEHYGFAVITRDLTEKLRQDEELRRVRDRSQRFWTAAISDALTGAYNRRYLDTHMALAFERAESRHASLLLFDIDHFKDINDACGHDAGDLVLKRVADIARQMSRESDMLFRHGGDEFVLYLPGVGLTGARVIAQRLREAVAHSTPPGGSAVTVSIGVAERRAEDTVDTWLRAADRALYEAKQAGRNRVA